MSFGRKFWDTSAEDTDTIASPPLPMSQLGDDYRSVNFIIRVNTTGTGDLEGAFTVEVCNDNAAVWADIRNDVASDLSNETAVWSDITAQLTETTALSIADGDEGTSPINISFLAAGWVRLKFTGSGGTDGSIEVWESRVRGA